MLKDENASEDILLDHYAGLAMQAILQRHSIVMVSSHGGGGAAPVDPINHVQAARTAFHVAEEMVYARRDCKRKLEIQRSQQHKQRLQESMTSSDAEGTKNTAE